MTVSAGVTAWVNKGVGGELLGTFPYTPIAGGRAEVEVYWINDPDSVGLRYPDNGRLAPGAGWLHYRREQPQVQEKFEKLKKEWLKLYAPERFRKEYGPKPKLLRLKNRGSESKPRLLLKLKKPKLLLKSRK